MADTPTNFYDDASQSFTQDSNQRTIFKAGENGCIDNCTAIQLWNTGSDDVLFWCKGHASETIGAKTWARLPAGEKIILAVESNGVNAIREVAVKCLGSDTTTLSWFVMERR